MKTIHAADLPGDDRIPGQPILAFYDSPEGIVLAEFTWGFTKANNRLTYNAREETVDRTPMWCDSYRHRRCLIPVEGFYEQGHLIQGKGIVLLAGIYQEYDGLALSVLTRAALPPVVAIHQRQPVAILPPLWARWLDPFDTNPVPILDATQPQYHLAS